MRVKDTLDTLYGIISKLVLALGGASSITLIAAAFVLGGALAAGQRFRIYDAVVLKTYGRDPGRLLAAYALEYLLIGLISVLFGVAMGSVAAGLIVTRVMEFPFTWVAGQAGVAAFAALAVTLALGLAGTFTALGRKPAEVLRNLVTAQTNVTESVTIANMASHPSGARSPFALDFSHVNSAFAESQDPASAGATQG